MNNNPAHIVLTNVRLSYVHLLEPHAQQPNQEPKYSTTILVPKTDVAGKAKIDAAIQAATQRAREKFGQVFPAQPKISVHDGDGARPSDGQPFGPECKGCWVFTASSKTRPNVVDINLQPIMDATEIYSGIYANVGITFFGYNAPQNKGIGVGIENVQKVADGEALGGNRASVDDDFAQVNAPAIPSYPIAPQGFQPATPEYPVNPQYMQLNPNDYGIPGYPQYMQQA